MDEIDIEYVEYLTRLKEALSLESEIDTRDLDATAEVFDKEIEAKHMEGIITTEEIEMTKTPEFLLGESLLEFFLK